MEQDLGKAWKTRIDSGLGQQELYENFVNKLSSFPEDSWYLAIFEGSPTAYSYSWCSDCVFAVDEVKKFKASYGGPVKFLQFKVGSNAEWDDVAENPFKTSFPYLTDLPTAILFRGQIDTMRVIAVEQKDLLYLCERSSRI